MGFELYEYGMYKVVEVKCINDKSIWDLKLDMNFQIHFYLCLGLANYFQVNRVKIVHK